MFPACVFVVLCCVVWCVCVCAYGCCVITFLSDKCSSITLPSTVCPALPFAMCSLLPISPISVSSRTKRLYLHLLSNAFPFLSAAVGSLTFLFHRLFCRGLLSSHFQSEVSTLPVCSVLVFYYSNLIFYRSLLSSSLLLLMVSFLSEVSDGDLLSRSLTLSLSHDALVWSSHVLCYSTPCLAWILFSSWFSSTRSTASAPESSGALS